MIAKYFSAIFNKMETTVCTTCAKVDSNHSTNEHQRLWAKALLLTWIGLGWHFIEFSWAIIAGLLAGSVALIGFGIDSGVESLAGVFLLWRLYGDHHHAANRENQTRKAIAISFIVLAAYITVHALWALLMFDKPQVSIPGLVLAAFTAPTMYYLAKIKLVTAYRLGSAATKSEGTQTMLCAYLSVALLVGLLLNAVFGWWWADPLTALFIAFVAFKEGYQSWKPPDDDHHGPDLGCC